MHYSPVRHSTATSSLRRDHSVLFPFDLHVLGMPPAFNLSQDQTLQFKSFLISNPKPKLRTFHLSTYS